MAPVTLKWGIMATGGIATTFAKDLLTNPSLRSVSDIHHTVVAAASSSSLSRAQEFLSSKGINAPGSPKAYGSYKELVSDPEVQIVYVASPHSHHFQNVMLALEAGKHVLCEKALTVNVKQARKLVDTAKAKGLFFMEAVWTRFFPLSVKIREMIREGVIGNVHRVVADLSLGNDANDGSGRIRFDDTHRMVNLDLAGGALLDLGVYSLTWVFQTLYHLQPEPNSAKESPQVFSAINKYSVTGADEMTSMILQFPKHNQQGIAMTNMRVATDVDSKGTSGPAIKIQGTKGEIQVMPPAYRPTQYRVILSNGAGKMDVVDCPIPTDPERGNWGHGMFWEADECARCLRDGKKESETMPWSESLAVMEVMDQVLREGGVKYPDVITTDVYDENSPLNTGKR